MKSPSEITSLAKEIVGAALFVMLLCSSGSAQATRAKSASRCNAAATESISYVSLPGHPFSTIASKDGCWIFVSLTSSNPKSANGVAMLSRADGHITLQKVFPVEAGPTGMVMTHDGKLLIVADDEYVVFMDVMQMTSGRGDPIRGYFSDGNFSGSVYANVTADDKFLFVSDENTETITVINLERARAEGFKESSKVGKIPVGSAPIALTFSPDEKWLYTTSQMAPKSLNWPVTCKPEGADPATAKEQYAQGAIIVVDVGHAKTDPAKSVVSSIPAGCSPVRMAISPSGDRVFVTARNSNSLLAFDTNVMRSNSEHALVGKVPVGSSPVGVTVVNEGKLVLVTNSNRFSRDQTARQNLSVIDAARVGEGQAAIVGSVPAGIFPREFGQSADGRTLFVANYNSSELEVIDLNRIKEVTTAPK
ncbi:MAG: beta-propeller fold lactonase family protein [Acidobacteriota bacterium]|nr:beta-propeller fold lactonase family protein [Acidobacteriota bacterium]